MQTAQKIGSRSQAQACNVRPTAMRTVAPIAKPASTSAFAGQQVSAAPVASSRRAGSRSLVQAVQAAVRDGQVLDRPLRVAVVGGGPSGACAAETLAKGGVETYLIERKLDNCKPCGGAIPLCMVEEFDLPMEIIDRKVTKMKMISPSNREVDVGKTLSEREWIGMCRREVMDDFLRKRATKNGAKVINGLMMKMDYDGRDGPITIQYNSYEGASKVGVPSSLEVDMVIGADGANSRVAKDIGAG
ncbi:geranylgeranyl diphosphate reductase, partial [Haematococcus lacustris]